MNDPYQDPTSWRHALLPRAAVVMLGDCTCHGKALVYRRHILFKPSNRLTADGALYGYPLLALGAHSWLCRAYIDVGNALAWRPVLGELEVHSVFAPFVTNPPAELTAEVYAFGGFYRLAVPDDIVRFARHHGPLAEEVPTTQAANEHERAARFDLSTLTATLLDPRQLMQDDI